MSFLILSALLTHIALGGSMATEPLPHSADDYDTARVVTIDAPALAALQDSQLRALLEFTGSCGRVLLIDAPPAVRQAFHNRAACGARYLVTASSADDLPALLSELSERPEPTGASLVELERLLELDPGNALDPRQLALFMATYLLVMIVLLARSTTRLAALGFSVVATLMVHVLWPPAFTRSFVAWAEANAEEHVAAYDALERNSSYRDGTYSHDDIQSRGSFSVNPVIEITRVNDVVTLCNTGAGISSITHASWREKLYALPRLQPGELWQSDGTQAVEANTPELALFHERSERNDLALLQPLPVADTVGSGWLLQHSTPRQGHSSCGQ